MNKPSFVVKVKPVLVRKKQQPQSNVNIVIKPATKQTVNLKELNKAKPPQVKQVQIPIRQNNAVSNKTVRTNRPIKVERKPVVKYVTRDIDQGSLAKIKQIRGTGKGKILIIVGNGPSINEVELQRLKNNNLIDTMSINKPDPRLWPTTYWTFFDISQLRRNEDLWNGYNGVIFNSTSIKKQKLTSLQIKNLGGQGFSKDLTKGIHIGRSSVYAAMQLGLWMEYDKIFIFGCDMNPDGIDGKLHFYGVNPDVDPNKRRERFKNEAEFYEYAANILSDADKAKFIFCSSVNNWPFINKFMRLRHEVAVQHILDLL